jgi:hypothetical protein
MKKPIIAAVLCAASVVSVSAGSAFAGEISGGGPGGVPKILPVEARSETENPLPAAECAYSGLEDVNGGPGVTQTPHSQGGTVYGPGAAQICRYLNNGRKP